MAWIEESELPDVPAIFQAMSLKPEALDVVKRLNEVLSFGNSGLSRVQEEGIATVVSVANRCRYGAMTHAGFLRRHSKNLEMASHFLSDYTKAPLSSSDRRILDFAVQVTQEPSAITEDDVDQLRNVGLDESQILAVVLIACLSNFMDRLANSLGVDLDPRHRRALENWLTGPAAQQDWLMPPADRLAADKPPKAKRALFSKRESPDEDSSAGPASPSEDAFTGPEPDDSTPALNDDSNLLEDGINSGAHTIGSVSESETGEKSPLDTPILYEEDADGADDPATEPDLAGLSANGIEPQIGQDDGSEGATANRMAAAGQPPSGLDGGQDDGQDSGRSDGVEAGPANQISNAGEPSGGQGDNLATGPAGQPGSMEEALLAPANGVNEDPVEQSGGDEDAGDGPKLSMLEGEPEPDTHIDVDPLIIRFVEECCATGDGQSTAARELEIAYSRWCDENDKHPLRQRDFGINLSEMGFLLQRRARGRHWWTGIALATKND